MADVSVERTIKAAPEVVWGMVSDVTRMGEWSPETTGCEWIGDTKEPVAGARFKGRNQSGWRKWSTVCKVVEAAPGKSFVFEVKAGPFDVSRWEYTFEPADGGTRVERGVDGQASQVSRGDEQAGDGRQRSPGSQPRDDGSNARAFGRGRGRRRRHNEQTGDDVAGNTARGPLEQQPEEPGWWIAADGKWYPPESAPAPRSLHPRCRVHRRASWSRSATSA